MNAPNTTTPVPCLCGNDGRGERRIATHTRWLNQQCPHGKQLQCENCGIIGPVCENRDTAVEMWNAMFRPFVRMTPANLRNLLVGEAMNFRNLPGAIQADAEVVDAEVVDAVLVAFINHVGWGQLADFNLDCMDLKQGTERQEAIKALIESESHQPESNAP